MELTRKRSVRAALESRTGVVLAAVTAAVLAGVLVFAAVNNAGTDSTPAPTAVFVANQLIPKGSTAEAIAEGHLYRVANIADASKVGGAVTDLSQIQGKVATADIYPGQQLSASAFEQSGGALSAKLVGTGRALSLPVDDAHGLIGNIRTGDRVDVYGGFTRQSSPVLKVLARDVLVLRAPSDSGSGNKDAIVLRASDVQAARFAFAADNGRLWYVLRPAAGAKDSAVDSVTLTSLLGSDSKKEKSK